MRARTAVLPLGASELAFIFVGLPWVMFSIKDLDGRYLVVNQAFADRASRKAPSDVVGRTALDLFAPELAVSYEAQDAALVADGRPVRRQLELITRSDGSLGWYITNKVLIRGPDQTPVAIAAVSVDEQLPADRAGIRGLELAVRVASRGIAEPLSASGLAAVAGMSTAQLERRMRRLIGLSPRQLTVCVRVEEALHRILYSDELLVRIASACGFSDQAAMSRQVKQMLGVSPSALREARRAGRPALPHRGSVGSVSAGAAVGRQRSAG